MKTTDLPAILSCTPQYEGYASKDVTGGYTSDLLSDVMSKAKEGNALVTIQAHKNTIAVASMLELSAVVICNDRPIPQDMIDAARNENIPLFLTSRTQFEVSGRLYTAFREKQENRA